MCTKIIKRKGDFEKIVVFVFLIVIGVGVMGYSAVKFIHFKVNIQEVGQEEYDRFTLTEKVLNAPGCAISRGVFPLDKLKNQNDKCQFADCKVDTTADWAYYVYSPEFHTKICSMTSESGQKYVPEFKLSEAIPILVYDKKNDKYMTAYMMIYGPDGIYSTSYSSGRSLSTSKEFSEKKYFDNVKEADTPFTFKCDAPQELNPPAKCVIERITAKIESFTGGRCSHDDMKAIVYAGNQKKETQTLKKGLGGLFNAWEDWTADNYFSKDVIGGEEISVGAKWLYSYGTKSPKYQVRDFRKPRLDVHYRVVCPPGMIADTSEVRGKEKNGKKEVNFVCENLEKKK